MLLWKGGEKSHGIKRQKQETTLAYSKQCNIS